MEVISALSIVSVPIVSQSRLVVTILDLAFWLVAPESQNALNTLHCYCAGAMGHAYVVKKRINAVEVQVYRKKGHNVKGREYV